MQGTEFSLLEKKHFVKSSYYMTYETLDFKVWDMKEPSHVEKMLRVGFFVLSTYAAYGMRSIGAQ